MDNIKNKVAIVTGGSRGIGKATVLKLASLGCNVAFNYHASENSALEVQKTAEKLGVRCMITKVDICDFGAVKEWVANINTEMGGLDILINNAGIIKDKPLMMMAEDDWKDVIDTNLNGMFNASRACIFTFMKQKHGKIINISSISGIIGLAGQTNYSASKGGMNAFTKALAKEVAGHGILVNAICPGFIETDILKEFDEEKLKVVTENIPLKKIGTVEDVTNCVEFLLSGQASYITGQIITVDGGLAMR